MTIKMLRTAGLSDSVCKLVSDCWLADMPYVEVIAKMLHDTTGSGISPMEQAETALAIRTRYLELDMLSISLDLEERFLGDDGDA